MTERHKQSIYILEVIFAALSSYEDSISGREPNLKEFILFLGHYLDNENKS